MESAQLKKQESIIHKIQKRLLNIPAQSQYFPFLTRFDLNLLQENANDYSVNQKHLQAYHLHSLAKVDYQWLDIYHLLFPELQKLAPKKEQQSKVPLPLAEMLKVICIRSLLVYDGLPIKKFKQEMEKMIQSLSQYRDRFGLQKKLKQEIFPEIDGLIQEECEEISITFDKAKRIYAFLQQAKKQCLQKLQSEWTQIAQNQLIFSSFAIKKSQKKKTQSQKQQEKWFLKSQIQKIYRIPAFLPQHRQKIIQNLIKNYHQYAQLAYNTKNANLIFQVKKHKEKQPILQGLVHYLKLINDYYVGLEIQRNKQNTQQRIQKLDQQLKKKDVSKSKQQQIKIEKQRLVKKIDRDQRKILLEKQRRQLVRDLVSELLECLGKTNRPYPALNAQAIIFNQKTLKPQLSSIHLLIQELGIDNIGSVEMKLSTQPTPKAFEFTKGHLENDEKNHWWLALKCFDFSPKSEKQIQQLEQITKKRQQMHVWRAICVIYFITNQSNHLMWVKYRQKYGENDQQNKYVPYEAKRYDNLCKKLYKQWQQNPQELASLLKFENSSFTKDKFSFTMKQLAQLLNVPTDYDSRKQKGGDREAKERQIMKIKSALSFNLLFLLQKEQTLKEVSRFCKNLLIDLAIFLGLINQIDQRLPQGNSFTEISQKLKQLKERFQHLNQKMKIVIKRHQSASQAKEIQLAQRVQSEINQNLVNYHLEQKELIFIQETSWCFQAFQILIHKQQIKMKESDLQQTIKKKKEYFNILNYKIILMIKVHETICYENLTKYKNFVLPFINKGLKLKNEYFQHQSQQLVLRISLALEIVEEFDKRKTEQRNKVKPNQNDPVQQARQQKFVEK